MPHEEYEDINIALPLKDIFKKKDGEKYLAQILELVKQMLVKMEKSFADMRAEHERVMRGMEGRHQGNYNDIKGQVDHVFVKNRMDKMEGDMGSKHEGMKSEMKEMMDEMMSKMHGKMGSMDEKGGKMDKMMNDMMRKMESKMESMKPPTMPKEYFDMMKEVKEELKKVKGVLENMPRGRTMGRAKSQILRRIDLTSQVDGSTSTFALAPDVVDVMGVFCTQFPNGAWRPGVDWTFSGRTLTLETSQVGIPQNGQTLWILAEVLFYP